MLVRVEVTFNQELTFRVFWGPVEDAIYLMEGYEDESKDDFGS